jgi:hypothetical protein
LTVEEELEREHLQHIRHIELEVAGLLGFYGIFLGIFFSKTELYGIAFWVSLAFLMIVYKLSKELEKHWKNLREIIKSHPKDKQIFEMLFPLDKEKFWPRLISVHRMITTVILGLTIYFLLYAIPPDIFVWFYIHWKDVLALCIAIAYLVYDATRDFKAIRKKEANKR